MKHALKKVVAISALSVAMYHAIRCPCDTYLACHKQYYLAALAVAAGLAFLPKSWQ